MPRFYFHVRNHDHYDEDPEGGDFSSVEMARQEAIQAAREMMAEKVAHGELLDGQCFEIADESGKIVSLVPFRSVIRLD